MTAAIRVTVEIELEKGVARLTYDQAQIIDRAIRPALAEVFAEERLAALWIHSISRPPK